MYQRLQGYHMTSSIPCVTLVALLHPSSQGFLLLILSKRIPFSHVYDLYRRTPRRSPRRWSACTRWWTRPRRGPRSPSARSTGRARSRSSRPQRPWGSSGEPFFFFYVPSSLPTDTVSRPFYITRIYAYSTCRYMFLSPLDVIIILNNTHNLIYVPSPGTCSSASTTATATRPCP
jgi:hypothetical protein